MSVLIGIEDVQIRRFLRKRYPRSDYQSNTPWHLDSGQVDAVCANFRVAVPSRTPSTDALITTRTETERSSSGRADKDEHYVIDICDALLNERVKRQHRFEWLRGDLNKRGISTALPVDAYYPSHRLVIEYRERQHTEPVPHFDKPDRLTVSGVHRGEQRQLYDRRRETEIPKHGLRLLIVSMSDLDCDRRKRLRRNRERDEYVLRGMLQSVLQSD